MTISSAPAITLSQLSLRFQDKILFENLQLDLPAKQLTCLLGPSGVGKTTLLRLLANLPLFKSAEHMLTKRRKTLTYAPDFCIADNKNYCAGKLITSDQLPVADRIAYMAQQDLLLPWLTVLENITLGYRLRAEAYSLEQALALLDSVGLSKEENTKPANLSAGMRQRVALARTLMEDKPIVLMDEPFSALDAITRYEMQTLTTEKLQNKTVLLITHDPWEALRMADNIVVLRGQPAHLSAPIFPSACKPRDLTQEALFPLQKLLLSELHMQRPQ